MLHGAAESGFARKREDIHVPPEVLQALLLLDAEALFFVDND